MTHALPIDDVLPDIIAALRRHGRCVLQAPPGAGKTTKVPLALWQAVQQPGKILVLEPRRLATRAAAERMAQSLGVRVGETVGFRIRGESKTGPNTQIEVITEGILTRMIQSDPDLPGVAAILFDEFHERSLATDLGLALAWEVRQTLREDLMLCVMSATLDAAPVAALLNDAPIITSEGRSFPVDIRHLLRPLSPKAAFDKAMVDLTLQALEETTGGVLVFLPGEAEIRRVQAGLEPSLPKSCVLRPLMGALPFAHQQKAIKPEPDTNMRKIVLATAIAETSLTIEDIRVVIDGGKARRARYDPNTGLSRLVTDPVSKAEATQRAGRAGRVAPGVAYRLWAKAEEGAMAAFPPAEIEIADLAPLVLELAQWGTAPQDLALLTQPPKGLWQEAQNLLSQMRAVENGKITPYGTALAALPVHPRLGTMLLKAGPAAAPLAALLSDRDILQSRHIDLTPALKALSGDKTVPLRDASARGRINTEAKRLGKIAGPPMQASPAQALALAFPDRIALRRAGDDPRYLLSGGMGCVMEPEDPMAQDRLLVVADMGSPRGKSREPTIRRALPIKEAELREVLGEHITWIKTCQWSKKDRKIIQRSEEKLGAIALKSQIWKDAPAQDMTRAMLDGVRHLGLRFDDPVKRLQARVAKARQSELVHLPDFSDDALMDTAEDWLLPFLNGVTNADQWASFNPLPALEAYLGWNGKAGLDTAVPAHFTTPLGRHIPIDYSADPPEISLRLQEMFGQTTHPTSAGQPLKVTLLSPAQRPIQTTMDIPGFWTGTYADVRKDMRAQYPKHPWPEDPTQADPTLKRKPRPPKA